MNPVTILLPTLIAATLVVAYAFGIRPILRQNPALSQFYETEEGWFAAVNAKLSGLKQRIATVLISTAGFIVLIHDQLAPILQAVGVDPQELPKQFLPTVPAYVWPVLTVGVLWLIQHFRDLADKQARANAEALLNAGQPLAAAAPGLPKSTPPSPNPLASLPDKVQ